MIKKFLLPDVGFNMPFSIQTEEGAKFLTVMFQPPFGPCVWFDCKKSNEPYQVYHNREFIFYPTGDDSTGTYLGSFMIPNMASPRVYHLYETTKE